MDSLDTQLNRYKSLIDSTIDWLWEINSDGVYTYSSPQVENILGYSAEEVIGKTPFSFMADTEVEKIRQIFEPIFAKRQSFKLLENLNRHKNGELVWLQTSGKPFFESDGTFGGYRGIDRDFTEQKTSQKWSHFFLEALNYIGEAAVMLDENGNIIFLNQAFYKLFGYQPGELLGKSITALNVPDQSTECQPPNVISQLDKNGKWSGKVRRLKKNGGSIPVYLNAVKAHDFSNNSTGYIGIYFDLTEIEESKKQIQSGMTQIILALSTTIEKRDPYTASHQNRVAKLSEKIAQQVGLNEDKTKGLSLGAIIHDAGKIHIPGEILNRPGALSDHEFGMIKEHPRVGYDIIKDIEFPWPVADMVLSHHERIDGSGYPNGVAGPYISIEARIIAVADVVEAISAHRPYRPALGMDVAVGEISKNSGIKYDADIVDVCCNLIKQEGSRLFE